MDVLIVDLDPAKNESNSNNSSLSKRRSPVYEYFTFKTPKCIHLLTTSTV
ncbi:hypothetical protein C1645_820876 [Glomus cerebriforme]|uniref:Uncharacterized protein n=1 Tax=Glomus cerebriforme TaxID=658196 RepID=A0A397T1T0_9GLOM|nr:hypothetical protein C1645_820876 [Glomus cerebriforme]